MLPDGGLTARLGRERAPERPRSTPSRVTRGRQPARRNIAHEMAIAMMKTSYSTIFNEGLDFSCVLLDPRPD